MIEILQSSDLPSVIVGFLLGLLGTLARDWWLEHKQKKRVRLMLKLETETNLAELASYWDAVSKPDERSGKEASEQVAKHVVARPLPPWEQTAWQGQTALIPLALSDGEIVAMHRLYGGLAKLTAIRSQLIALWNEDAANIRARDMAQGAAAAGADPRLGPMYISQLILSAPFSQAAPQLGEEFTKVASELLETGNPFEPQKERPWWRFWEQR